VTERLASAATAELDLGATSDQKARSRSLGELLSGRRDFLFPGIERPFEPGRKMFVEERFVSAGRSKRI
jgi:hypothetical protein